MRSGVMPLPHDGRTGVPLSVRVRLTLGLALTLLATSGVNPLRCPTHMRACASMLLFWASLHAGSEWCGLPMYIIDRCRGRG